VSQFNYQLRSDLNEGLKLLGKVQKKSWKFGACFSCEIFLQLEIAI